MSERVRTPVLLIVYKRAELTRRALEAIAAANPSRVFVAADGPRRAEDAEACRATRDVVSAFDERLDITRNFSDVNLGCGVRVYTAIDWAFTLTEELIILEDDCLPHPSFFRFCDELLARYRDDERVMHISGNNFVHERHATPYSYYFSRYTHAWGWATWRRAWRHFDWSVSRWPELARAGILDANSSDPYEREYWREIFDRMHKGAPDVWDYQWNFACWSQSGLAVLPATNLVSNAGFGDDATHTKAASEFLNRPAFEIGEIRHPPYVFHDAAADALTFDRNFGGAAMKAADSPRARLRRRLNPVLLPLRVVRRAIRRLTSR